MGLYSISLACKMGQRVYYDLKKETYGKRWVVENMVEVESGSECESDGKWVLDSQLGCQSPMPSMTPHHHVFDLLQIRLHQIESDKYSQKPSLFEPSLCDFCTLGLSRSTPTQRSTVNGNTKHDSVTQTGNTESGLGNRACCRHSSKWVTVISGKIRGLITGP